MIKFLLTSNLGRYLAEGIFYVRDALAHRPRHLLAQRKVSLDTFDHWAKTKNLVDYSTWGFFWRRMTFPDFSHFTPGHKPALFFRISWAFSFFSKIFAFCPNLLIFFPVKAESSYFSNFIMCAPARAHARANFTLNAGNLLKIPKSENFQKMWFWRARVRAW